MNQMPRNTEFISRPSYREADLTETEQAVIAACLVAPDRIGEAAAKLAPGDFQNRFHQQAFAALIEMRMDGRAPSIEALVARFGDEEIESGLTVREYLKALARGAIIASVMPMRDAIETILEASGRRQLAAIAGLVEQGASSPEASIKDVATLAVSHLDDVLSAFRGGTRQTYDARSAAQCALTHLDTLDEPYPTTGLIDLDRMIGGFPRGQMTVVAGRPGMGKSAVATSTILRAAQAGHATLFFSLEMTVEQLAARNLTDLAWNSSAPIAYQDILHKRKDRIGIDGRRRLEEAQAALEGLPLTIEVQGRPTVAEIAARTRKIANELEREGRRLDLVVVDHMLLVAPASRYAGNRVQEVREISNGLAALAKDLDVSMVALCQLNRQVEGRDNKRPTLADLRDSGSIEEDASVVCFLYRPAYYLENLRCDDANEENARLAALNLHRNKLEIIVAKNRDGQGGIMDAFVDIGANAVRDALRG